MLLITKRIPKQYYTAIVQYQEDRLQNAFS
jgi:hypothetical protein